MPDISPPPHVFIVQGDLLELACDAILIPTDTAMNFSRVWDRAELDSARYSVLETSEWGNRKTVVCRYTESLIGQKPLIYLGNVGTIGADISNYLDVAREFIKVAAEDCGKGDGADHESSDVRIPLVALPALGTGKGGGIKQAGKVISELLPVLQDVAIASGVDVVLVCWDAEQFAAALAKRKELASQNRRNLIDHSFDEQLVGKIAHLANTGNLALFLGAGISAAGGLPLWDDLLIQLAKKLQIESGDDEMKALKSVDVMSQASILNRKVVDGLREGSERIKSEIRDAIESLWNEKCQSWFKDDNRKGEWATSSEGVVDRILAGELSVFKWLVVEELSAAKPTLTHYLCAALPVKQIATTNYDMLFENACGGGDSKRPPHLQGDLRVLPYERRESDGRWLLKLHGCVNHPEDIILSREDYARYHQRRAALGGVVQAMLLTKHVLFLGFSLKDENFFRVADAARQVVRDSPDGSGENEANNAVGTALMVEASSGLESLWRGLIKVVEVGKGASEQSISLNARRVDILLDSVLSRCEVPARYFLHENMEGALSDDDLALKQSLRSLIDAVSDYRDCSSPARSAVIEFLSSLGWSKNG